MQMDPIYLHVLNAFSFFGVIALMFAFAPAVNRFLGIDD